MSISILRQTFAKSQTKGSARTFLGVISFHANDCCGVAWPSEPTLQHEVNISLQRLHELKHEVPAMGELLIVRRPGKRTLYFPAWQGQAYGPQGDYLTTRRGQHQPGCPLRDNPVDLPTYFATCTPRRPIYVHPVEPSTTNHINDKKEKLPIARALTDEEADWRRRYDALMGGA